MGANREQYKKQSPAEVSKKLSEEFNIDYSALYRVWLSYNEKTATDTKPNAIALVKYNLYKQGDVFDYLICLALETINKELLENLLKEQSSGEKAKKSFS